MKGLLKKICPPQWRLKLRLAQRQLSDWRKPDYRFVQAQAERNQFPIAFSLSQPIRANAYSANKHHNLALAIQKIDQLTIAPQETFSFWRLIKNPSARNGFKAGRNLLGNQLATDIGGGLCQLSGTLYHLSLMAGLEIIERHPHSMDIYTEKTRYTPLGSDATVVYGHKDLRIRNNLDHPITFHFALQADQITAHICAPKTLDPLEIAFLREKETHTQVQAQVYAIQDQQRQLLSSDVYQKLYPGQE